MYLRISCIFVFRLHSYMNENMADVKHWGHVSLSLLTPYVFMYCLVDYWYLRSPREYWSQLDFLRIFEQTVSSDWILNINSIILFFICIMYLAYITAFNHWNSSMISEVHCNTSKVISSGLSDKEARLYGPSDKPPQNCSTSTELFWTNAKKFAKTLLLI